MGAKSFDLSQVKNRDLGLYSPVGAFKLPSMPPPWISATTTPAARSRSWPDWMHNTVKFAPINMQEADGPIITGQDPEQTITTVCHDCNTGWMCLIENKAGTRLKPSFSINPSRSTAAG